MKQMIAVENMICAMTEFLVEFLVAHPKQSLMIGRNCQTKVYYAQILLTPVIEKHVNATKKLLTVFKDTDLPITLILLAPEMKTFVMIIELHEFTKVCMFEYFSLSL